jgi:hypothetical protein
MVRVRSRDRRSPQHAIGVDLVTFGAAVVDLLRHRAFAARLGHAGRNSVRSRFLPDHHFVAWSRIFESVLGRPE